LSAVYLSRLAEATPDDHGDGWVAWLTALGGCCIGWVLSSEVTGAQLKKKTLANTALENARGVVTARLSVTN